MDLIVQKAVEIGAVEIVPLIPSQRSFISIPMMPRKSKRNGKA